MPKLTIIVPVFNEAPNLGRVVDSLMSATCPIEREWLFVDDCSSDESLNTLQEKARIYGFRVISQKQNRGKGSAVRRALAEATGDFIMIQDADFEYSPGDIPNLLQPLLLNQADVVYGSRYKNGAQVHRTFHYFVNFFLTLLSNIFSGIFLTDMETCYKIFRADLLKAMKLRSQRFGLEVELTAYIAKIRVRIFELPISYFPRTHLQGKKITWVDGLAALYHLIDFNFLTSREQAFFQDKLEQFEKSVRTI